MGDILLITPFLRQIRSHFPEAKIDMVIAKRFAEIIRHNPYLSTVIELDTKQGATEVLQKSRESKNKLPLKQYDIVIDEQVNLRSWLFRLGLGKTTYTVDKFRRRKLELVRLKKGRGEPIIPIAERYRHTAHSLGIEDDGRGLELWLPEESELEFYPPAKRISVDSPPKHLAIAPGARHYTKRWLPEQFAATARLFNEQFNTHIVLLGGKDDDAICDEVRRAIPFPITDASGAVSLYDTARALDKCDGLICNDSGIMHLAAARRVPVAAIFGSTVQEFGFAPFRVPSIIIEKELDCRPCTHIGRADCPKGHFNCMNLITADEVVAHYLSIKG
jgi:heptosyltransferase-2